MKLNAEAVIERFGLTPLPDEGGYFRETYRAGRTLHADSLPPVYRGPRSISTAIFYLLTTETCSALHRLPGDEVFHFYAGDPVELVVLGPGSAGEVIRLSNTLEAGTTPQHVVPGGWAQGSRLAPGGQWALLGTTMAPGFDVADFELISVAELETTYSSCPAWARELCVGPLPTSDPPPASTG